ncbi:hypothetical protein OKW50_002914 [Paraburkholderia youngii]|uniref:hypothetical protein n=1 Tax=Paraburkholderia youngii TaxID=2782701 RepID=UPI003D23DC06
MTDSIAIFDVPAATYWPAVRCALSDRGIAWMRDWHALPDGRRDMSDDEFMTARKPLIAGLVRAGYEKLSVGVA